MIMSNMNGSGPDKAMVALMQSILGNKPLTGDDIHSVDDARKELNRIRHIMHNFQNNTTNGNNNIPAFKKVARNAIHEEEHINDYVKNTIPKEENIRQLIHNAIKTNVLFEHNTQDELHEIIDVFEPCWYKAGERVIKMFEKGDEFFVVESGELSVKVHNEDDDLESILNMITLGNYQAGTAFGELALIFGSPRRASIIATTDCKLWRIKRGWFRGVVGQHRKRLHLEKVNFLSEVDVLNKKFKNVFEKDQLDSLAQLLKQEYFREGSTILRQGEVGDTFYIIQSGEVSIHIKGQSEPIATLGKGKFFGEMALVSEKEKHSKRAATVKAISPMVVCYVMTRDDFNQMMGNLKDALRGNLALQHAERVSTIGAKPTVTYKLEDLKIMNILGEGAFGKVKLVKSKTTGECYALKAQGKQFIIENDQQTYVLNELRLMRLVKHQCVLHMHCAFQDSRYIYFLLDLLPGGELMNILQYHGKFSEQWTRFYTASVLLAFTEFRKHNVAYRDLKPENMVLDAGGFCVLVDLGLAKQLEGGPTFTFCGTPDYIAPEIIRGTGHTLAVDYWSLGVLLYELHNGSAPFLSYDPTSTAKKILKGHVDFPSHFSSQMKQLIKGLLTKDPTRRLGCRIDGTEEVMKDRFFHGFDWQGLLDRKIDPPYKPRLPDQIDSIGFRDNARETAPPSNWTPDLG